MTNWLLFGLAAPAIFAVNNYIDKYLVSRQFEDYTLLPLLTGVIGFIAGIIFWLILGRPVPPPVDMGFILLAGSITLISLILYFKALQKEETSTVILLFQMTPVFIYMLSYIFLGEKITYIQLVGFILIMGSSIALSINSIYHTFKIPGAFFLILGFDMMSAVAAILMKHVASVNSIESVLVYESLGVGVGALIMYVFLKSIRKSFLQRVKKLHISTIGTLVLNEIVFLVAKSCTFFAYILGPVSLVSVLGNTQIFYGILYGYILNIIAPRIFNENLEEGSILKKVVFSCLLFMGILLIY